jgi:hypothetical protein
MLERLFPQQSDDKLYVEDVMSVFLYTGNGSTQTITNGIDLAGKGGMLWRKSRNISENHFILDTARGTASYLESNTTSAAVTGYNWIASFNSDGFTNNNNSVNSGPSVSWTFRKAPKFFDVVTYTGNGANRTIAHNLGVAPGMILVKRTDTTGDWQVYHRSNANTQYMVFNNFAAVVTDATRWNSTTPTASVFSVGTDATVNASGGTYVAYLFAHDPSADGIIQCGTYQGSSSSPIVVNLGWEPQWLMVKNVTGLGGWVMADNMRGFSVTTDGAFRANGNDAEVQTDWCAPTATGFELTGSGIWTSGEINSGSSLTKYIYMAIRRGPMRTPTLGTSVFNPTLTSTDTATTGFPVDVLWQKALTAGWTTYDVDRLRGGGLALRLSETNAENVAYASTWSQSNTGVLNTALGIGSSAMWSFRRAPGFMDVVCYTGGGDGIYNHNLGAAPELIIEKNRGATGNWNVNGSALGNNFLRLNSTAASANTGWSSGYPVYTSTQFSPVSGGSGGTYVSYLFASAPGVSKVGTYTGNGSSQTINCAFTTGARFVMIKRTDSTGDWYVWDSARGIVAGNDPYLALNSTAVEVTSNDSVDTDNTGFVVNQVAASNINVNAATYIYLAIA